MIWENHFLVFDVSKGPKVIIEALNTYGEEGWECSAMIAVANTNIVVFLKRRTDVEEEPKGGVFVPDEITPLKGGVAPKRD